MKYKGTQVAALSYLEKQIKTLLYQLPVQCALHSTHKGPAYAPHYSRAVYFAVVSKAMASKVGKAYPRDAQRHIVKIYSTPFQLYSSCHPLKFSSSICVLMYIIY